MKQYVRAFTLLFSGLVFLTSCSSNSSLKSEAKSPAINDDYTQPDAKESIPITHIAPDDILGDIAISPEGIYTLQSIYPSSESILFTDFQTKQQVFMCSAPNCTHDTEACSSYLQLKDGEYGHTIFFHNGALYLVQTASETDTPPHITRIKGDCNEEKSVCILNSGENFLGSVFGYGEEILAEIIRVEDSGNQTRQLEKIDCETGKRQTVVVYPNNAYYGAMRAVGNNIAYIKIDGYGCQYFWLNPAQSGTSLSDCANNHPISNLYDGENIGYTIQGDYLCGYNYGDGTLSAKNLLTAQSFTLDIPKDLSMDNSPNLLYLFDDRFALTLDNEDGSITNIILDKTGHPTNARYTKTKMTPGHILTVSGDTVFLYDRTIKKNLKNQGDYGVADESCYIDIYSFISKDAYLRGDSSEEISTPIS